MRPLWIVAVVGIAILVAWVVLKIGEWRKRRKETRVTDIAQLRRRKHKRGVDFTSPHPPRTALERIANLVGSEMHGRVAVQSERQFIAHTRDAGASKFKGMLFTPPEAMPLRIAAQVSQHGSGTQIRVMLDEDYGFQMFVGPAKRAFAEKYAQAFDIAEARIRAAVDASG